MSASIQEKIEARIAQLKDPVAITTFRSTSENSELVEHVMQEYRMANNPLRRWIVSFLILGFGVVEIGSMIILLQKVSPEALISVFVSAAAIVATMERSDRITINHAIEVGRLIEQSKREMQ